MLPADVLLTFFGASLLLGLAPGPDNLFVIGQSAVHGRLAGVLVTLGLCTGLVVHTTAVALGVATLFQASEPAFTALKFAGAGYLAWLAWQAFHARAAGATAPRTSGDRWRLYRRGIVMNVTNPKVSLFFLAFLPQFADPARGSLSAQVALLGLVFIGATLLVFGAAAILAGWLGERLARDTRAQLLMNRVAGVVFAALALKLVTTQR